MKKMMIILSVLFVSIISTGCNKKAVDTTETSDEVGVTMRIDKMDMTFTKVVTTNNQSEDNNLNMLVVELSFENTSKSDIPIGANDFKIKDNDGKLHEIYGMEPDNFGEVVAAGQKMKGLAYYELPKTIKSGSLVYQPKEKRLGEWAFTVPNKKQTAK